MSPARALVLPLTMSTPAGREAQRVLVPPLEIGFTGSILDPPTPQSLAGCWGQPPPPSHGLLVPTPKLRRHQSHMMRPELLNNVLCAQDTSETMR